VSNHRRISKESTQKDLWFCCNKECGVKERVSLKVLKQNVRNINKPK
jgi:hypothetical protein